MYGLLYNGPYNTQPHLARLLTPALNTDTEHCLKISLVSFTRLVIYQTSLSGNRITLLDSGKAMDFTGKITTFLLVVEPLNEPFYLEILWPNVDVKETRYVAAVKAIDILDSRCKKRNYYKFCSNFNYTL